VPDHRSTMRTFFWFLGLLLAGFAAMALFAYPAWLLLHPHFNFPFHRIAGRVGMLALLIGFLSVARRLRLADRASLGYGIARRLFIRELCVGFALGVALMLLVVAVMLGLGLRTWQPAVVLDTASLATAALQALGSALAVALIEETFLRGAMFSGVARESGNGAAILLTAALYAATHFIARYHIAAELVVPTSGVAMVAGSLKAFADPFSIGDAFLALFAVGVLLAAIRAATGNIAGCIGLHAGWVWVMLLVRATSVPDASRGTSFLVSGFDGFVGWLVLGWTLLIGWPLYQFYLRRSASTQPAG
jgi:membrane protease YdiL (CAAX protease family)